MSRNIFLQARHPFLVTCRILRFGSERPVQELIGVVRLKADVKNTQPLAVRSDFLPVTLDVLQILGEVGVAPLKYFPIEGGVHSRLEIDILGPSLLGLRDHKVRCLLHREQKPADLVWVLLNELLVADVQDRAEAATTQFGQLVDAQHLDVRLRATLRGEPLLKLDHLHVLQPDAGVNLASDNGLGNIHSTAHSGVVRRGHAVVRCQLVDLDLAEFADVANTFSLEGAEVRRDARRLQVHDASEGLVQKATEGKDRESTGLGLREKCELASGMFSSRKPYRERMDHGLEAEINFAGADDFGNILSPGQRLAECLRQRLTLGSFGSSRATLIPCSLKKPFAWARKSGAWYGVACLAYVNLHFCITADRASLMPTSWSKR